MRTIKIAALLLALLAAVARPAWAAANAGTDPLDFLNLDAGARPVALGGAYAALASDSNALLYNPAGLGRVRRYEATFMHNAYFQGINQEYIGLATRQGFGLNLDYVGYGTIQRTTISQPNSTLGTFGASDLALSAGYGYEIKDTLSVGGSIKAVRETIDTLQANAIMADAGVLIPISPIPRLTLGAAIQNMGPTVKFLNQKSALPLSVRVGVGWGFTALESENTLAFDMVQSRDGATKIGFGGETVLYKMMAARLGFNARNDAGMGITAGLGWTMGELAIDYAIVPYGELGITHHVSATVRWGKSQSEAYRPMWSGREKDKEGTLFTNKAKEDPESPEAHFRKAEEHRKAGYYSLALKELAAAENRLTEKDQRMVYFYEQVAYISWLRGDVNDAKSRYLDGLKLAMDLGLREPVVADAYAGLGMCVAKQGDVEYALKIFKKALEANPSEKTRSFVEREINVLSSISPFRTTGGGAGEENRELKNR